MRVELVKSMEWNHVSDMISAVKDDAIGKRSIKILQVGDVSFRAIAIHESPIVHLKSTLSLHSFPLLQESGLLYD